ncbi:hypothetical protein [Candidatus Schmidhempelia bombi]|uniref:Uncharacterized protein n=1 Tax=Candidatus Schmidhempelia bombi str. Bimp TaxID=1387197 RepID=A0AB94IAL9_9GAMM|nr:hypothetical protein [Candidatus Schmidhempelia bombi]TEA26450.1 hypothetical protein O970_08765 [Candidatus Schmidhempelia bombi str. Bimp]
MNVLKYLLVIISFFPQVTQAIYRIYSGNIGDKKIDFYISGTSDNSLTISYVNTNDYTIISERLPKKVDNEYVYENYTYDLFGNKDTLILKNFDFSENKIKSENDFLIGTSLKFGDFKLKKIFEYNVIWSNGYKENHKDSKELLSNIEFKNVEFLQIHTTKDFYFKLLLYKNKKEDIKITGVNIYSKKNGELIQRIKTKKNYLFYDVFTVEIGDFDFDGNENDFSLVEGDTRGTNVPHMYFIYDESQNKFIDPNLEGYVFVFDPEKKIATSTKTCGDVILYENNIILNKMYYLLNRFFQ